MSVTVDVLYFAALRDHAGRAGETVETSAGDLAAFYMELHARHGFPFAQQQLRVAVDGAFADWQDGVCAGSTVAFIPPVSGG